MKFTNKDGELRIYSGTTLGKPTTGRYYVSVLFTNADLTIPIGKPKVIENLEMDRGNMDTNATFNEESDNSIMEPQPITFSAKLDDQTSSQYLVDLFSNRYGGVSGVTVGSNFWVTDQQAGVNSSVSVGLSTVTLPSFKDTSKSRFRVEVLWDGSNDIGRIMRDVYFPPEQQTITEGEDNININLNGMIYGTIGYISAFTTGTAAS